MNERNRNNYVISICEYVSSGVCCLFLYIISFLLCLSLYFAAVCLRFALSRSLFSFSFSFEWICYISMYAWTWSEREKINYRTFVYRIEARCTKWGKKTNVTINSNWANRRELVDFFLYAWQHCVSIPYKRTTSKQSDRERHSTIPTLVVQNFVHRCFRTIWLCGAALEEKQLVTKYICTQSLLMVGEIEWNTHTYRLYIIACEWRQRRL